MTELSWLIAVIPAVVAGAISIAKPLIPARFVPLVGVVVGAVAVVIAMVASGADLWLIVLGGMVGAFAPSQIADKVFDPLKGVSAVKKR